ncbi:MAG: SDR family oxidoreductase [Bacilli bacterium]|nr:SDR family oxidoreductase [Bacilli bacterium]
MVALITGAASDIGKSLALTLNKNGYDLILLYHNKEIDYLDELNNAKTFKCDISNEEEVKNVINTVDKIDVLINCAATYRDNEIKDKTKEEFMRVLEVNLVGTFLVTKYAVNKMDNGIVINISSLDSTKTFNSLSVDYIASKAGVNTLSKTFSLEYKNIRFITLLLPWIKTSSVLEMNPDYLKEEMNKYNQNKLMETDEVGKIVLDTINSDTPSGSIIEVNYD